MKTSHEVQVEIREKILPLVRNLNDQVRTLYQESVSRFMGLQGLHGPESDISVAYQLLDGAKNLMKSIAEHFELPVADRDQQKDIELLIKACQVATDRLNGGADLGDSSQSEDLSEALTAVESIIKKELLR